MLSGLTALAGFSGVLFLLVPVGRMTHKLPDNLPLEIRCSADIGSSLKVAEPYECSVTDRFVNFDIDVTECNTTCFDVR